MTDHVEVFADITCPFTHVGLKRVVEHLERVSDDVEVIVRAWPLEWVNGQPLVADIVATKAGILDEQLGLSNFSGFDVEQWPETTIPALNLAASAYAVDPATGLAVSLELRAALFEEGRNVADPAVLTEIAARHGLEAPGTEASAAVRADYEAGQQIGVIGSPHFYSRGTDFFCPALDIGHDESGGLTARFDPVGLQAFLDMVHPAGGDVMTPTEVVDAFIAAIERKDVAAAAELVADDVSYENMPMDPIVGRDAMVQVLEGFLAAANEVAWPCSRQFEVGNVVINERLDRFQIGDGWLELPIAGFFEVVDGRITLWRDYFDMNSYVTQLQSLTS